MLGLIFRLSSKNRIITSSSFSCLAIKKLFLFSSIVLTKGEISHIFCLVLSEIVKGGAASATATANSGDNKEGDDKVAQAGHVNTNPIASSTSNVTTNNDTLKQQGQAAGQQAVQNKDTEQAITDAFNKWRTVCQAVISA